MAEMTSTGLFDRRRPVLVVVAAALSRPRGEVAEDRLSKFSGSPPSVRLARRTLQHAELTAQTIMSATVVAVGRDDSLRDAWRLMSSCGVQHLAITDGSYFLGTISDQELVTVLPLGLDAMRRIRVGELVGRTTSVLPETRLSEIVGIMNSRRLGAVPVVDGHGVLLGLISASDLVRAVSRMAPGP